MQPNKFLQNKLAIVTGGSRGLGAHIALSLAEAGADIILIARNMTDLKEIQKKIKNTGSQCEIIQCDIEKTEEIELAIKTIYSTHHPDILINNAGISKKIPMTDTNITDWDHIINTNLRATFLFSKLIAPGMIKKNGGKIVNISSIGTFYGTPGLAAYNASKAGINQLTKTMAVEFGVYNIQVNTVCPSVVLTDMGKAVWEAPENKALADKFKQRIPLKRFAKPEEISSLVLFLVGPNTEYINGVSIPVDNGARLNPF